MTEENPRIQKRLEKFRYFLLNVPSTVTPRSRRLREGKRRVLETQMIRQEIVSSLKELYELAPRYAKSRRVKVKEKEKWARLASYIAQTINTILNSHDTVAIED